MIGERDALSEIGVQGLDVERQELDAPVVDNFS
jgi:hypothetical protein